MLPPSRTPVPGNGTTVYLVGHILAMARKGTRRLWDALSCVKLLPLFLPLSPSGSPAFLLPRILLALSVLVLH